MQSVETRLRERIERLVRAQNAILYILNVKLLESNTAVICQCQQDGVLEANTKLALHDVILHIFRTREGIGNRLPVGQAVKRLFLADRLRLHDAGARPQQNEEYDA